MTTPTPTTDKMRERYADGIYCLAYHQLTPSQQFIVDAAVKVALATKENDNG